MFREYTIEDNDSCSRAGSYTAHINVNKSDEVVSNYFVNQHRLKPKDLEKILSLVQGDSLSILMNMDVSSDFRGDGYGNDLLEDLFYHTKSPILLICDNSEVNFVQSWYERNGFTVISSIYEYPIMLKSS